MIKQQCFGVEIEMTGITREQAGLALSLYFGTDYCYIGSVYDAWQIMRAKNGTHMWLPFAVSDRSQTTRNNGTPVCRHSCDRWSYRICRYRASAGIWPGHPYRNGYLCHQHIGRAGAPRQAVPSGGAGCLGRDARNREPARYGAVHLPGRTRTTSLRRYGHDQCAVFLPHR